MGLIEKHNKNVEFSFFSEEVRFFFNFDNLINLQDII